MAYLREIDRLDFQNRNQACQEESDLYRLSYIQHNNLTVVRDDFLCGGTKSRLHLPALDQPYQEYVYLSNWYGGAQIALTEIVVRYNRKYGTEKKVVIITREPPAASAFMRTAQKRGAHYLYVPGGMTENDFLTRYLKEKEGRYRVPSGFRQPEIITQIGFLAQTVRETLGTFDECWAVVASGALIKGLQLGQLATTYYGLCVFQKCPEMGKAIPIFPDISFEEPPRAEDWPPYPSASRYDAKLWKIVRDRPGRILVWNVM